MIDVWNRVMSNISVAVKDKCTNISTSETDTPAKFPTVRVSVINMYEDAMDLENSENGIRSDMRIQTFSNKSLTEARSIMALACDAMREMGYRRTFGPREIENVHDRNVKRMEARFRRFVSVLDDIPKFEQP